MIDCIKIWKSNPVGIHSNNRINARICMILDLIPLIDNLPGIVRNRIYFHII